MDAVRSILARAEWLKGAIPVVANNLAIAQHRDTLRYAKTRDGTYLPKLHKFEPDDLVYHRRGVLHNTLQIKARQHILRVLKVKAFGGVVLQGRCGNTISVHQEAVAPCHMPYLDGTIDPRLARPHANLGCEVCTFRILRKSCCCVIAADRRGICTVALHP